MEEIVLIFLYATKVFYIFGRTNILLFPFPVSHMGRNDSRGLLRAMLSPNSLDKISLGIHKVEIDTVVDEVVLAWLHAFRRREIHAIRLTHVFDLLPGPRKADEVGVELGKVGA